MSEENVLSQEIALGSQEERGLLFNLETGGVLFSQNIYQRTYPASITKIMTAVLALEYGNMEDTVTITAQDLSLEEGSQMSGMEAGDTVTMDQLFHTLVVYSANDAAMAIARQVGGSVDHFVEMMNQKAKELGMTGTHFVNPHGLHQEEHYTTPYDVYLMLHYASQIPEFLNTAGLASYQLDLPAAAEEPPAPFISLLRTSILPAGAPRRKMYLCWAARREQRPRPAPIWPLSCRTVTAFPIWPLS